ncbi:hypothetical protein Ancab_019279 [Ancistrocladus abbreviatus]
MATYAAIRSSVFRSLLRQGRLPPLSLRAVSSTLLLPPNGVPSPPPVAPPSAPFTSFTGPTAFSFLFSHPSLPSRNFSSDSDVPSNVVLLGSEEELNNAFRKAEDESLPAIFYFTAEWCGPCRFLWPNLKNLTKDLPHITTYKIDIDQEGLGRALGKLNIFSVPTLYFFSEGKKADEVVGADIERIKNISHKLYSK